MSDLLKKSLGSSILANLSGATQPKKKVDIVAPKEVKAKAKPVAKKKEATKKKLKTGNKKAPAKPGNLREGDDRFQTSMPLEMIKKIRIRAISEELSLRDYCVMILGKEVGYSQTELEEMTKIVKGFRR